MHHDNEEIVCPNCGTQAYGNYCYECGQQNHLHKDTLWGMILHFFEHYFHYDNKFWQTIRTLLFKPGELTLAYWNKQRMRFISPVSLYIFISAVYFTLSVFSFRAKEDKVRQIVASSTGVIQKDVVGQKNVTPNKESKVNARLKKDPDFVFTVMEKMQHDFPKLYFFMIPVTAFLLKLAFIKRKELFFVDHLIFTLHFHSIYFFLGIITLLSSFLPSVATTSLINFGVYVVLFIYLIKALRIAYNLKTGRALAITLAVGLFYGAIFLTISSIYFMYILHKLA